jgi:Rrf2 family transcriptional regulator, iron-sulfur cluster assembly transcription factor
MVLSKSFGYALRGTLYIASKTDETRKISIEEMASTLGIPKHFLAKVMKLIVKAGVVNSTRGQQGGFFLNENTLKFPLVQLITLIEGEQYFNTCLLSIGKCNAQSPCPLHHKIAQFKDELHGVYRNTTIGDLLKGENEGLVRSITSHYNQPVNLVPTD